MREKKSFLFFLERTVLQSSCFAVKFLIVCDFIKRTKGFRFVVSQHKICLICWQQTSIMNAGVDFKKEKLFYVLFKIRFADVVSANQFANVSIHSGIGGTCILLIQNMKLNTPTTAEFLYVQSIST